MPTQTLQNLFEASAQTSQSLLLEFYRDPAIIAYNRLEPRSRTEDFTRSLRAEIRDPLWLLTRQWQMGEFEAEDAGSAIDVRLLTSQAHIDRVALRDANGHKYNQDIPLETMIEQEYIPFTHGLKVQIGQFFLKLHTETLRIKYMAKYRAAFPFLQDNDEAFRGQIDGLNLYTATKSRDLDGEKLLQAISDSTFMILAGIEPGDQPEIEVWTQQITKWFMRQFAQPEKTSQSSWNPSRLTYQFRAAAPLSDGGQIILDAERYHEGRLDWYSFEVDPNGKPISTDAPDAMPDATVDKPISFLPAAATFKGMPNPRFWEMEDRQINFGNLNAKTTDQFLLIFAEMGLVYGNDWFVIPYNLAVNTLVEIKGLVVTDVFGDRTLIQAADAGVENNWQHWSMFNLSNKDEIGSYNRQFFLPAALTETLESEPIEQVNFMRDEMTNMVWAVEDRIPDALNAGINGNDAADKVGIQPPAILASSASIRYVLGTTVPENWIPFLPVHKPGSDENIMFQRAAMPKFGVPPQEVIKAKGMLLNEVPPPYYIDEEEIPSAGTIIQRTWQRTRWYGGRTFLWIGRSRQTGRGKGSSNLLFDQIDTLIK